MSMLVTLWPLWVQRQVKKSGHIEILHKLTGDRTKLKTVKKQGTGIEWSKGSLSKDGANLLDNNIKLLPDDSPYLLSNFVKAALADEIDIDLEELKLHVRSQPPNIKDGWETREYVRRSLNDTRKRKASILATGEEAEGDVDDAADPTPRKKRGSTRKSSKRKSSQGDDDDDNNELSPQEIRQKQLDIDYRSAIPDASKFSNKLKDYLMSDDTPPADAAEVFQTLKKMKVIKSIKLGDPTTEPGKEATDIKNWLYAQQNYEPSSCIDRLARKVATSNKRKRGEQILEAKAFMRGKEELNALLQKKNINISKISHEQINALVEGSVSLQEGHLRAMLR